MTNHILISVIIGGLLIFSASASDECLLFELICKNNIIIRNFSVPVYDVEDFFPNGSVNTTALLVFIQSIRKDVCK